MKSTLSTDTPASHRQGRVSLVGMGPGAADLLTVRAVRALRTADVWVLDAILHPNVVDELGLPIADKTVIPLYQEGSRLDQPGIHALLLRLARQGLHVARLKSGDPFIFGRGNEESEFLAAHGVAVDVIPGISMAAGLSAAGIPLTWRGESRSFAAVTAREAHGALTADLPLADSLVIFMGRGVLRKIADKLLADGWAPDTAVAVLERVTHPWEQRWHGTLATVDGIPAAGSPCTPALVLIGNAASARHRLTGRPRILHTGLTPATLRDAGDVLHWPALAAERLPADGKISSVIQRLQAGEFAAVVFDTPVDVREWFRHAAEAGFDSRLLSRVTVLAQSTATAAALLEHGIRADAVDSRANLRAPVPALRLTLETDPGGATADANALSLLHLSPHPQLGAPLPKHDILYFERPDAVTAFTAVYGPAALRGTIWAADAATAEALLRHGARRTGLHTLTTAGRIADGITQGSSHVA